MYLNTPLKVDNPDCILHQQSFLDKLFSYRLWDDAVSESISPDIMFFPSRDDRHPDHQRHRLVSGAVKGLLLVHVIIHAQLGLQMRGGEAVGVMILL